jgi:hypothetical protein
MTLKNMNEIGNSERFTEKPMRLNAMKQVGISHQENAQNAFAASYFKNIRSIQM